MSLTSNSVIIADSHITVWFTDGFQVTLYSTDPNFTRMKDAVRDGEWDKARELSEPVELFVKRLKASRVVRSTSITEWLSATVRNYITR